MHEQHEIAKGNGNFKLMKSILSDTFSYSKKIKKKKRNMKMTREKKLK